MALAQAESARYLAELAQARLSAANDAAAASYADAANAREEARALREALAESELRNALLRSAASDADDELCRGRLDPTMPPPAPADSSLDRAGRVALPRCCAHAKAAGSRPSRAQGGGASVQRSSS